MRYVFRIGFALALSLALMVGCSDENGEGGSGGTAGTGGEGGSGGVACIDNVCPCTEAGIRAAIAEGGGPFTFACDGPTAVVTEDEIVVDNDVILDGEGNLTLDGNEDHRVLTVTADITVELQRFTVSRGQVAPNEGGGVYNEGTLTLTDSTVSDNGGASAVYNLGMLTLTDSAVSDNVGLGGAVHNEGTAIVTNSTVSGNRYLRGIYNGGTLTLTNSTVSGNLADGSGGGSVSGKGEGPNTGGGIANGGTGMLTVTNSTVSDNTATEGGGIFNVGTATLTNSTVSDNESSFEGGGVYNLGTLTLTNSTVSGNVAERGDGDGIYNQITGDYDNMLALVNSLIVGACAGPTASGGSNIESPGDTCGFDQATDQVNVTAELLNLGPLADNGGPTMTHALLTEPTVSVAIDAIPAQDCVDADERPLAEDQRGEPRPETGGTMCDVGAFEVQP